jgi:hypothetical protein
MRCPVVPQFMPNLMPTRSIVDELSISSDDQGKTSSTRVRLAADLTTALRHPTPR